MPFILVVNFDLLSCVCVQSNYVSMLLLLLHVVVNSLSFDGDEVPVLITQNTVNYYGVHDTISQINRAVD